MKRSTIRNPIILGALVLGLSAGAHAQSAVGQVQSATGSISAQNADGTTRGLACGDDVFAGERVVTDSGASVGVLMGDVLAHLSGDSTLRIDRTDAGGPDATLERGRVRVIDVRDDGAPGRLAAGTAASVVAGNDAEAYVLEEKTGEYAVFCEWENPLAVTRGDEAATADAGDCVIAKPNEKLYTAKAHDERIAASGGACSPGLRTAWAPHFSPESLPDVAAGPVWSNVPGPLPGTEIEPCGDPGAVCFGVLGTDPGVIVVSEPPPGTGPQPGAGGPFPGTDVQD